MACLSTIISSSVLLRGRSKSPSVSRGGETGLEEDEEAEAGAGSSPTIACDCTLASCAWESDMSMALAEGEGRGRRGRNLGTEVYDRSLWVGEEAFVGRTSSSNLR